MPILDSDLDALIARCAALNAAVAAELDELEAFLQAPPSRAEQDEMDAIDRKFFG